jgi:hypothetical protein
MAFVVFFFAGLHQRPVIGHQRIPVLDNAEHAHEFIALNHRHRSFAVSIHHLQRFFEIIAGVQYCRMKARNIAGVDELIQGRIEGDRFDVGEGDGADQSPLRRSF